MKKTVTLLSLIILISLSVPVFAAAKPSVTEKKMNDVINRFNSLEATWGRFQIGGNLNLETNSHVDSDQANFPLIDYDQELNLFLDAFIDRNTLFSLKLFHQGGWGLNYQNMGNSKTPLVTPLQIDEAFLRLEYPLMLNYLGRFRYSFGPFGLISDFFANPAEGAVIQRSFGKNYHIAGLYSRVNTEYTPGTNLVESTEEYLGARIGWSDERNIIGLNLVPNGITGEKSISLDWSYNTAAASFATELGWYSFASKEYPEFQVDWTPGALVSYRTTYHLGNFLQIKAGYFTPEFTPSYSSLTHSSGDSREWFAPNTQGLEVLLQNKLPKKLIWENRAIALTPIKNFDQPDLIYRYRTSIIRQFSPVNQVQFGIDLRHLTSNPENVIFLNWNLQF